MNCCKPKCLIFLLLVFSLLPARSFSEQINLTSCDWKPYNSENLPKNGFTCEIIKKAFEYRGHTVNFTFLPWKRAIHETEKGKFHGLFAAYYNKERAATFAASAPYATGPLVFCTKKNTRITYKTMADLKPYTIGVVAGYANTDEFDQADYLIKDAVTSDIQNIKKLLGGRVDIIIIDKYLALYHLKNTATLEGNLQNIKFLDPPLKEKGLHIMFSRAIPGYEKRVDDFNAGLNRIKENGIYSNILLEHDFL